MYIHVRLIKGFTQPLWYKVPDNWNRTDLIGTIVKVPFRTYYAPALVINTCEQFEQEPAFTIRPAHSIEAIPNDPIHANFIQKLSTYYQIDQLHFIKRMRQFLMSKETKTRARKETEDKTSPEKIQLTAEQQAVYDYVAPHIAKPTYSPTVIHGVTGSGKTEIYKKLITQAINDNKAAILLLPEVTLAVNFQQIMLTQLSPEIQIFGFHSSSSVRDKKLLWQSLLDKKPALIIGVHLPILLPIPNLGLIVVDEEHETGFQEKKHPKVNSKEAAIWRAQLCNIPILLGSATPSIATLHNVKARDWKLFQIKKRFAGAFPQVQTVNLADKKQRRNFWISTPLEQAIKNCLQKKEQAIIFINRRGYSFFVQCKPCGAIFSCPSCSVSLTLHANNRLSCHYCGHSIDLPQLCTSCGASKDKFLKKGIGTQQVVSILQKIFPGARIDRADMDSTVNKKKWQQTVEDFTKQDLDILVGTQTITKGYHFPHVTLVGVLWADINLHFPIYNAAETTLQQLIQVAGRAGRQSQQSNVIIQTLTDHTIFNYLNELDYPAFYQEEIENRAMTHYPPHGRLVEIELKNSNEMIIEQESEIVASALRLHAQQEKYAVIILGPAKPPVHKIKNMYSRKIYLKGSQISHAIALFRQLKTISINSSIFFTPNPLN